MRHWLWAPLSEPPPHNNWALSRDRPPFPPEFLHPAQFSSPKNVFLIRTLSQLLCLAALTLWSR